MEYISKEELFRHMAKQEALERQKRSWDYPGDIHDNDILEDCRGSLLVEMERAKRDQAQRERVLDQLEATGRQREDVAFLLDYMGWWDKMSGLDDPVPGSKAALDNEGRLEKLIGAVEGAIYEPRKAAPSAVKPEPISIDARSEIDKLADDIAQLREEMYELHNQQEAYHSLIANAIEKVRCMVMNRQIEDLPTSALKKELRKRRALKKNREACE